MENQKIKDFVGTNSYLELEEDEDNFILFGTRENETAYEEVGQEDLNECRRVGKLLVKNFPVSCKVSYVDEWAMLEVFPRGVGC